MRQRFFPFGFGSPCLSEMPPEVSGGIPPGIPPEVSWMRLRICLNRISQEGSEWGIG